MNTNANSQISGQESNNNLSVLPPHSSMMVWSILVTIFCCLIGGIIAIIYSSRANDLYFAASMSQDNRMRMYLYQESVRKNATAKTWILISAISLFVCIFLYIVVLGGTIAALS